MNLRHHILRLNEIKAKAEKGFALPPALTLDLVKTAYELTDKLYELTDKLLDCDWACLNWKPASFKQAEDVVHEPGHVPTSSEEDGS